MVKPSYWRRRPPAALIRGLITSGLARYLKEFKEAAKGDTSALSFLSDQVLSAPVEGLADLEAFSHLSEERDPKVLDLSVGYPVGRGWSKETIEAAYHWCESSDISLDGYAPYSGWPAVLSAVAKDISLATGTSYSDKGEILLTSGCTQGMAIVWDSFLNPGDGVVVLEPAYLFSSYSLLVKRAKIRWVKTAMRDGNLELDTAELSRALAGAKILLLNSPSNPAGAVISRKLMENILRLAARHNVLVVSDEIYQDFCYGVQWTSAAAFPEFRNRVVLNHSYSKSHRLAGWRVGYLAAPEVLLRPMRMMSALYSPYAPSLAQGLLGYLLTKGDEEKTFLRLRLQENCNESYLILKQAFPGMVCPRAGMFHWLPVPAGFRSGQEFAKSVHRELGVLLLPGEHFGPHSKGFVRLSFGASKEVVLEASRRLARQQKP